jgi:hypothetical protein
MICMLVIVLSKAAPFQEGLYFNVRSKEHHFELSGSVV